MPTETIACSDTFQTSHDPTACTAPKNRTKTATNRLMLELPDIGGSSLQKRYHGRDGMKAQVSRPDPSADLGRGQWPAVSRTAAEARIRNCGIRFSGCASDSEDAKRDEHQ
ncbi:hypothetical protein GCM10010302_32190 [Streptomyces polychromogenes]|uniref:Uncharacterized protein n=1 Tax=Streptomyces polychromogenes TaxID=67342 RepID=A0ABP3F402_9ACTN